MAIKSTPAKVDVNGPLEDTTALLISLRPRLKELAKSSDARGAFLAREARQSVDNCERESEKQRSKVRRGEANRGGRQVQGVDCS